MTRLFGCLIEDGGGFHHLHHEGGAPRAPDGRRRRRGKRAVPQSRYELLSAGTKLPAWAKMAISAFCRRKVDLPAILGPVTSPETLPWRLATDRNHWEQRRGRDTDFSAASTTGWRPRAILNDKAIVHCGPDISSPLPPVRPRPRRHPAPPAPRRWPPTGSAILQRQGRHLVEQGFFQRQRLLAGFGDPAGEIGQFVGGKTHRPRHGLTMAEQIARPFTSISHQFIGKLLG